MKRIIVIGPKDLVNDVASKLSDIYDLPIFDQYVFVSSSWKDRPDGVYVSSNLAYQQAKKMHPDMLVCLYPPITPDRIKKYKVVNKAGATMKDPISGAFLDDLPFLTARKKLREIRIHNQELLYDIVPYEK